MAAAAGCLLRARLLKASSAAATPPWPRGCRPDTKPKMSPPVLRPPTALD